MSEPVIRVEGLTRIYRSGDVEVPALRGVSLTVMPGEFVAIMGSSGSGKSTLMAILGCLDRPTGGHYFFEGLDAARLSEPDLASIRSERLGFVFQSFNLLPRTSALENVTLPLFYSTVAPSSREVRNQRARVALKLLGLENRERNTPGQLSGGQQQRVAIARALINTPSLLLADEPTGNLDTKTSHEIMETLVKLNREQGVTIIVVTHEPDIAAYASRVVTMRDGQIVSDRRAEAQPRAEPSKEEQQPADPGTLPSAWRGAAGGCAAAGIPFLRHDDPIRGRTGHQPQPDALRADHARRLHRRRRSHRHGCRGAGRERGRAQANRKFGHKSHGCRARRRRLRGLSRRLRQCLDAHH